MEMILPNKPRLEEGLGHSHKLIKVLRREIILLLQQQSLFKQDVWMEMSDRAHLKCIKC